MRHSARLALFSSFLAAESVLVESSRAIADAELPRLSVDTSFAEPGGNVIQVPSGGDLQAALDSAAPGDVIELAAGALFTGNFQLPAKSGNGWIYVRTSALGSLPPPGARVGPGNAGAMAKIVSPKRRPAPELRAGASNYRFIGIEITTTGSHYGHALQRVVLDRMARLEHGGPSPMTSSSTAATSTARGRGQLGAESP